MGMTNNWDTFQFKVFSAYMMPLVVFFFQAGVSLRSSSILSEFLAVFLDLKMLDFKKKSTVIRNYSCKSIIAPFFFFYSKTLGEECKGSAWRFCWGQWKEG